MVATVKSTTVSSKIETSATMRAFEIKLIAIASWLEATFTARCSVSENLKFVGHWKRNRCPPTTVNLSV